MTLKEKGQEFQNRLEKLKSLRQRGIDPYPNDFKPACALLECIEKYGNLPDDDLEKADGEVAIAGRIVAKRDFGKATFAHIQDRSAR